MSEIVDDLKIANIEISGDLGLNLSSENARIKHTGEGLLELFSYGRIEITTESGDEDDGDENQGNLNIDVNNRMLIHVDGEDTCETSALTIETEEGSIKLDAQDEENGKIILNANSNSEEAIEIEAERGGVKIHAEGCETGNVEIEAKLNVEITAEGNDVDAIEIEAEHGGVKIHAEGCETGNVEIEAKLNVEITAKGTDVDAVNILAENGGVQIQSSTNSYTQFIGGFVGNTETVTTSSNASLDTLITFTSISRNNTDITVTIPNGKYPGQIKMFTHISQAYGNDNGYGRVFITPIYGVSGTESVMFDFQGEGLTVVWTGNYWNTVGRRDLPGE